MNDNKYSNYGWKTIKGNETVYMPERSLKKQIYKNYEAFYEAEKFSNDEIVYIPMEGFTEYKGKGLIKDQIGVSYTKQNFLDLTRSRLLAEMLFDDITGENIGARWSEYCADSNKHGHWIEAYWAYEKIYLEKLANDPKMKGKKQNSFKDFKCVWGNSEFFRSVFLVELKEKGVISEKDVALAMSDFQVGNEMG